MHGSLLARDSHLKADEAMICLMCYLCLFAIVVGGMIVKCDPTMLPAPWPMLDSLWFNLGVAAVQGVIFLYGLWQINVTSSVAMYAGLFSSAPLEVNASADQPCSDAPMDTPKGDRAATLWRPDNEDDQMFDALVGRVLEVQSLDDLISRLETRKAAVQTRTSGASAPPALATLPSGSRLPAAISIF